MRCGPWWSLKYCPYPFIITWRLQPLSPTPSPPPPPPPPQLGSVPFHCCTIRSPHSLSVLLKMFHSDQIWLLFLAPPLRNYHDEDLIFIPISCVTHTPSGCWQQVPQPTRCWFQCLDACMSRQSDVQKLQCFVNFRKIIILKTNVQCPGILLYTRHFNTVKLWNLYRYITTTGATTITTNSPWDYYSIYLSIYLQVLLLNYYYW